MKKFRNLKLSVKLITAFMVIALIAGGVGVYGVISLSNSNASSSNLFRNYGNSQGYLGYVLGEFQKQRAFLRDILIDKDVTKATATNESIKSSDETMMKYLDLYSSTCITEAEATAYKELLTKVQNFRDQINKVIAAGLAGNFDQAYNILHSDESTVIVQNATKAIDDAVAENTEVGDKMLKAQEDATGITIIIMIALAVMAVALAIVIGLAMTRSITKPVKVTADQLTKMANGDDHGEIDSSKFGGEFRQMVDNLNGVSSSLYLLLKDSETLAQAGVNGTLSVRADETRHKGGYRRIIEGFNKTLDSIVEPVKEATSVLVEIEKGNLDARITSEHIGDYAIIRESLNNTAQTLKEYINEISYTLGEMSKGNLNVEIVSDYHGDFMEIKESINGIIDGLNTIMMEIKTAADQVSAGARQVSDGVQETSQGATEQASSIEELTATITQIAQQTKQNAMSANKANELTVSAVSDASHGNDQMKAMQKAMSDISESSQNISKIIKVIDDIAFQTNILALNAAVEAARAGVHGKGFAVVAEEVRNLAARSANAAKETTDLIEGSIRKTEVGTKIADETEGALSSIVEGVEKAAQLVSEIASASNEQAGAITQVNNGIEQMSQVVQTNSATAEEGAAASEELSSQAELLKNTVGTFRFKAGTEQRKASEQTRTIKASGTGERQKSPVINMSDADFGKY